MLDASWTTSPNRSSALVASRAAENYGDGASMEELHRLSARFEAFVTEATAAFETNEEWAADGAKTAVGVDRHALSGAPRCRRSAGCASGGRCATCPDCARAWRDGEIGVDQAKAIAWARRHRTEASMTRDEAMLVAQAAEMGFEDFYRALSYWKQLADPDGADADEEERRAARNVYLEASVDGMWLGPDDARPDFGLDRRRLS